MRKQILKIFSRIGVAAIIILLFVLINMHINEDNRKTFEVIPDSNNCAYQIEEVKVDGDDLVIEGWFFELRSMRNAYQNIPDNRETGIVLLNIQSLSEADYEAFGKYTGLKMNMSYNNRQDVDKYFKCEYDYSKCGFSARVKKDDVDLVNGKYQIAFKPDESGNYGILSSYYLDKGNITHVDPLISFNLDVAGTDLETIIKEGVILAAFPEHYMYIYQLKDKIYWIADEGFKFNSDGNTGIVYMMDTTQFDKLPIDRIEGGNYWANIGDSFEKYEITNKMDCGKYRVSVRDIPKDFSVIGIETGQYVNGNYIWYTLFRPVYSLFV